MRIFFVTNNYTPYAGGVVNSITATTDALRAQGHEVFIITLNFVNDHLTDDEHIIRIACPIKFMYKKNHMAIPWRPTKTITQLLQQYAPTIIHVHHPFLLGVSALRAARSLGIPCLFTHHTLYEHYAHYLPIPPVCSKPLIRSAAWRFCNAVDGIIAPSSAVKKYLCAQKVTTPITVIPSPLRPFFTAPTVPSTPNSSKIFFELLIVTKCVPEKNIPFVFDVFTKLPNNFRLTIVGYGTDYEAVQKYAFVTLQLSHDRVQFIHKPSPALLLTTYRAADLFIFSSQIDTQGLVLAESMSQGVPVIALDGPGQRDIIQNGVNGFIVEHATDAAQTIMKIATDQVLHKQLTTGARITAQKYHIDHIVTQLLNFYHAVVD